MEVRLLVTGRMYHLASELPDHLSLADGTGVRAAIARIQGIQEQAAESPLPASCLVALNGRHLGTVSDCADEALKHDDELTLIAPVAGG